MICNLKLRGLSALDEGFILAMLSLNAQRRLNPAWRVVGAEAAQAVIYDLGDAESFVAWSRAQQDSIPIPVACAEEQPLETGWFLQKPLRADQLIEVLNGVAAQLGTGPMTSAPPVAVPGFRAGGGRGTVAPPAYLGGRTASIFRSDETRHQAYIRWDYGSGKVDGNRRDQRHQAD